MDVKLAEQTNRKAIVYVRQSSAAQVVDHTESQRRQYALAKRAQEAGFVAVEVIDDDLGTSGSGLVDRPGFRRLLEAITTGAIGAVFCLEVSRLARSGHEWHLLLSLCAVADTAIVDEEGVYDPSSPNDSLLLGLKGTMSAYELTLLQTRALKARDEKAARGELHVQLPPGYVWDTTGVVLDPDERVCHAIRLVFRRFEELRSAYQVTCWLAEAEIELPVMDPKRRIVWKPASYDHVRRILKTPVYAGAFVYGRTKAVTDIVDGRPTKRSGIARPPEQWLLIRDHHVGYITWEQYKRHEQILKENAYVTCEDRGSAGRGGRALLTRMLRCGCCGRKLRVVYGAKGRTHSYLCGAKDALGRPKSCLRFGGKKVDAAVASLLLEVVQPKAIEAALQAFERARQQHNVVVQAAEHELEQARYEAHLAERRYEHVDPAKRLVARELEARWEAALARVEQLEQKVDQLRHSDATESLVSPEMFENLAHNLPAVWDASSTNMQTKQRLIRVLITEIVASLDSASEEVVLTVHWAGGRHSEIRVRRRRRPRRWRCSRPAAVEAIRTLAAELPDLGIARTLNRMGSRSPDDTGWTESRVREVRERLEIAAFDPNEPREPTVSTAEAARRLSIPASRVRYLLSTGALKGTRSLPGAPWRIPVAELDRIEQPETDRRRARKGLKSQDPANRSLPLN